MKEFKCILCWRTLQAEDGQRKITCPYCGKTQRVPGRRKTLHFGDLLPEGYVAKLQRRRHLLIGLCAAVILLLLYVTVISPYLERDAKYRSAVELMEEGNLAQAYDMLYTINIRNSRKLAADIKAEGDVQRFQNLQIGDSVFFGTYEQDRKKRNGGELIEWQVLDRQEDRVLLLSRYCLERRQYYHEERKITWAQSDLRKWLNEEFLETAFHEDDRQWLLTVTNKNPDNPVHGTEGGPDTEDTVFVLSEEEARQYFANDVVRQATATDHVKVQKAYRASNGNYIWWLRSPGYAGKDAMGVETAGGIDLHGRNVNAKNRCVRAAVWIDCSAGME